MYLSILRPSRRDALKQALNLFITETAGSVHRMSPQEREIAAVLVLEAQQLLREIVASEQLLLGNPPVQATPTE